MRLLLAVVTFLVAYICDPVQASITVSWVGPGTVNVTRNVRPVGGDWQIELTATVADGAGSPDVLTVFVKAQDLNDSIEYIRVTADKAAGLTTAYVHVVVLPNTYPSDTIPVLKEITKVGGTADLVVSATDVGQLGTTGVGSVRADCVRSLRVVKNQALTGYTGDIHASITVDAGVYVHPEIPTGIEQIACGNNLLGNVRTWNGPLTDMAVAGRIGAAGSPVSIDIDDDITRIIAREIHAHIATPSLPSPRGDTTRIETTAGPFVGSLTTYTMEDTDLGEPCLLIRGDLDADLTIGGSVKRPVTITGALLAGRTISICDDLKAEAPLTTSAGGLRGQVIINASNTAGTPGLWVGDVSAGAVTLSPEPDYTQLAASIGGGAVGLLPFDLHGEDSLPADGASLGGLPMYGPGGTEGVVVRHYGPVVCPTCASTATPLVVLVRPLGSTGAWTDRTANFDFTVQGVSPFREVLVAPKPGKHFDDCNEFRLESAVVTDTTETRLKSKVGANTHGVTLYTYTFTLNGCASSIYDLNGNQEIESGDIAEWIAEPADFDADGQADAVDLADLMDEVAWRQD